MTGATAIAALVVDGQDIHGVVCLACLIVTGDTLGASGNLAECYVVNIAVTGLIVVMTDNTGYVGGASLAVGDGIDYRRLQRQSFRVGLCGGIIIMAEVAAVTGSVVQSINIGLSAEGACARLTKGCGVARMTVGTGGAGTKGDGAEIVDSGGVVTRRTMTNGAVSST